MKIPTQKQILEQAEIIKLGVKEARIEEREYKRLLVNQINKLIRMLKSPVLRVELNEFLGDKKLPKKRGKKKKKYLPGSKTESIDWRTIKR